MRVVHLLASKPNALCGVADYAHQLVRALKEQSLDAEIETFPSWSFKILASLFKKYAHEKDSILHLQYPTLTMGKSFAPALLPLLFPGRTFLTFHEFEQFNIVRKLYFLLPAFLTKNIIFTNDYEQGVFVRFFGKKSVGTIIPVGNNIGVFQAQVQKRERLVYFGQIAPDKGIEEFLETVRLLRAQKNDLPCALIGALVDPGSELAKKVLEDAKSCNIECVFNASAEDVSKELQSSTIALLPFPQGMNDKRGSALACLKHGLAVLTRHSVLTPSWAQKTTYAIESPDQAARLVADIASRRLLKSPNPSALSAALSAREWSAIAQKHKELYLSALEGKQI